MTRRKSPFFGSARARGPRSWFAKTLVAGVLLAALLPSALASAPAPRQSNRGESAAASAGPAGGELGEQAIQQQIRSVYQAFYDSYRLGAGDVIAVHIDGHPDDSIDRVTVSPAGQIYYPLLGNVSVAGKTVPTLQDSLTASISEYISQPRVTVSLLEAGSARIGVLGDVKAPGIILMARPMRVLDAIKAVGGITDSGNSSKVAVLREYTDGSVKVFSVSVKRMLQGKASPEENISLNPGDTIIVHGNWLKKVQTVSSLAGLGTFFTILTAGRGL